MSIHQQNNRLAVCDYGECDTAGRKWTQMVIAILKRRSIKIEFELPYIAMISILDVFVL